MTVYNAGPIFTESVSNVTATNSVEVGTIRRDGDEEYVYVYNAGSSTVNPGYACVLSGVSGYSVTVSSITAVDFAIGHCKHAAIPTGSYGWLLTRGFAQVQMGGSDSMAAGQILRLGLDGTYVLASNATGNMSPIIAKAMGAAASGGTATAYIKIW